MSHDSITTGCTASMSCSTTDPNGCCNITNEPPETSSGASLTCFAGRPSYAEAVGIIENIAKVPQSDVIEGSVPFSQIRRFLIAFLDMIAYIRQEYNEGNLSAEMCQGFIQAQGVQPSTCQCAVAQLCVKFLFSVFPTRNPDGVSAALGDLLMAVLTTNEDVGDMTAGNNGAPELIDNVLLMSNVVQQPIQVEWDQSVPGHLTPSQACTILTYASPGLLQSSLNDFSLCGSTGVAFSLDTLTSIPNKFITNPSCGVTCGEWLSQFQKSSDTCKDYVQSQFNFTSAEEVVTKVCQPGGNFFCEGSTSNTKCKDLFLEPLNTLQSQAAACCKSSRVASRQKGLRWFLLGLGIVCAVILLFGIGALFKKLNVTSKKHALTNVYQATAEASQQ